MGNVCIWCDACISVCLSIPVCMMSIQCCAFVHWHLFAVFWSEWHHVLFLLLFIRFGKWHVFINITTTLAYIYCSHVPNTYNVLYFLRLFDPMHSKVMRFGWYFSCCLVLWKWCILCSLMPYCSITFALKCLKTNIYTVQFFMGRFSYSCYVHPSCQTCAMKRWGS